MKTYKLALYERALQFAAEEAYRSEIIDIEISEYFSKEQWIEGRISYWLGKAEDEFPEQP